MTIYIDILFLENFILNFIILYATGLISKTKVQIKSMESVHRGKLRCTDFFFTYLFFYESVL